MRWLSKIFKASKSKRARGILRGDCLTRFTSLRQQGWYSRFAALRAVDLRRRCEALIREIDQRLDVEVNVLRSRLDDIQRRLEVLIAKDQEFKTGVENVSASAQAIVRRSTQIPGQAFGAEVIKRERAVALVLGGVKLNVRAEDASQSLASAMQALARLRSYVEEAEEVLAGFSELESKIGQIDEMAANQDTAVKQVYDSLILTVEQIRSDLAAGRYFARRFRGASELLSQLQRDLEDRRTLARSEVELWLSVSAVAEQFPLAKIPTKMNSSDVQHWQELRVEIGRVVMERAAATRSAYARLFHSKRNLRFSMAQLKNWDKLEAFARSATRNSKYKSTN